MKCSLTKIDALSDHSLTDNATNEPTKMSGEQSFFDW